MAHDVTVVVQQETGWYDGRMDPHVRARATWYRIAALFNRNQKDLAESMIQLIEAEIHAAQYATLLEAAKLVLKTQPTQAARALRERADQIRQAKRGSQSGLSPRAR